MAELLLLVESIGWQLLSMGRLSWFVEPTAWIRDGLRIRGQIFQATGAGGCVGDIGTHAENPAEFITGLKIKELAADLSTFEGGRNHPTSGRVAIIPDELFAS